MNENGISVLILDTTDEVAQETAGFVVQSSARTTKIKTIIKTDNSDFREQLKIGNHELKSIDIV